MSASEFVKSATTATSVAKSQADIITMLTRYGATGFGFRRVGSVILVTFHLPRMGGGEHTVEIPVDVAVVSQRLGNKAKAALTKRPKSKRPSGDETQADRVAWRVLHLWIDAALSAVSLGAQSIEEAFFAHLVVHTEDGKRARMVEYIGSIGAASGMRLPAPHRLLLPSEAP